MFIKAVFGNYGQMKERPSRQWEHITQAYVLVWFWPSHLAASAIC